MAYRKRKSLRRWFSLKDSQFLCCLHPLSSLKSFTSAAKNNVFLFTLYSSVNEHHPFISNPLWVNTSSLMNMVLKAIFESISQYRWYERISSEQPLNATRLSHKLGLREELWWESMDPSGSGFCVSNVCARIVVIVVLLSHCLLLRNYLPPWILAVKCALQPLRNWWRQWRMALEARSRQWIRGWWGDSYQSVRHQRSPSISSPLPCRHLAHASANTLLKVNWTQPWQTHTHTHAFRGNAAHSRPHDKTLGLQPAASNVLQ